LLPPLSDVATPLLWRSHVLDHRAHLWTSGELFTFARGLGLHPDRASLVLDLGCGWGSLGLSLAHLHPRLRVTGIDLDESLLATGREIVRDAGFHRRVTLRNDDVQDLDSWCDDHPPVVVCQALLVHMPRPLDWLGALADRLAPGTRLGLVESDSVVRALGLRDSVTDPDPGYRRRRVEVTEAIARGAATLGVDRRLGSGLSGALAAAGLRDVHTCEISQSPITDSTWLRRRLQRRLDGGGDPVDRHLAEQGGLAEARFEAWIRLQQDADRQRMIALQNGEYHRQECGTFMAWATV